MPKVSPVATEARREAPNSGEHTATTTTSTRPPSSDWRRLATLGGAWTGSRPAAARRAAGTTSRATKRKTTGISSGSWPPRLEGRCWDR